jgi:hypothetical protein
VDLPIPWAPKPFPFIETWQGEVDALLRKKSPPTSILSPLPAMDLQSLKEAAANLTLYDLKAGVRKVQNGESRHTLS